jgi:hypothetical protein
MSRADRLNALLLSKGADINAGDWKGDCPLDWAVLRGNTEIVKLLRRAIGPGSFPAASLRQTPAVKEQPRLQNKVDADSVYPAISASLGPLQRSGQRITQTKACITCHQHSLVALTVGLAREHGLQVDEGIATQERSQVNDVLGRRIPLLLLGSELDPTLAAYTLVGFLAENQKPNPLTDALVHYLALHQQQDGHWQPEAYRPPEEGSSFQFTALAARGLQAYASRGRAKEVEARIQRARTWLGTARPQETVDSAFQLLGLVWTQAPAQQIQRAAEVLLRQQREDGGWAQLPTLPSDAYATGQALFSLHEAGAKAVATPNYRRGVEYLLRTQLADGSWFVRTRCFPVLEYSNSGFPHGRSQFISAAATCWATMALIVATPPSPTDQIFTNAAQ